MKRFPGELTRFKVRPGNGHPMAKGVPWYYTVIIFDCPKNMRKTGEAISGMHFESSGAVTISGEMQQGRPLGYVLFNLHHISTEVVAHESVHMAVHFSRVARPGSLNLNGRGMGNRRVANEEMIAYATGRCADLIVQKMNRYLPCEKGSV